MRIESRIFYNQSRTNGVENQLISTSVTNPTELVFRTVTAYIIGDAAPNLRSQLSRLQSAYNTLHEKKTICIGSAPHHVSNHRRKRITSIEIDCISDHHDGDAVSYAGRLPGMWQRVRCHLFERDSLCAVLSKRFAQTATLCARSVWFICLFGRAAIVKQLVKCCEHLFFRRNCVQR